MKWDMCVFKISAQSWPTLISIQLM